MTGELDIRAIRQGRRYTPTETARILGVSRQSLYRYFRSLEYFYDADGKRFYTGKAIAEYWNTNYDPRTGGEVAIDPETGEARPVGKPTRGARGGGANGKRTHQPTKDIETQNYGKH